MKTFYTLRAYSDMCHLGGSHYTENPCKNVLQNEEHYNHINKIVLPKLFKNVYKLLEKE